MELPFQSLIFILCSFMLYAKSFIFKLLLLPSVYPITQLFHCVVFHGQHCEGKQCDPFNPMNLIHFVELKYMIHFSAWEFIFSCLMFSSERT